MTSHDRSIEIDLAADCIEALATIKDLKSKLAAREWQPIETAPKDKAILIYHEEAGSCEAWYETETLRWYMLDGRSLKKRTHYCLTYLTSDPILWQPLPPKKESENT